MVVGRECETDEACKKCIEIDTASDLAVLARQKLQGS